MVISFRLGHRIVNRKENSNEPADIGSIFILVERDHYFLSFVTMKISSGPSAAFNSFNSDSVIQRTHPGYRFHKSIRRHSCVRQEARNCK